MPEINIERSGVVDAAPSQLWEWMANIEDWPHWKPFIISSSLVSGRPLEMGSKLKFKPKMGPVPVPLTVKIVESDKPRRFAWGGGGPGLKALHSFDFEDLDGKTKVVTRETFSGFGVMILKLFVSEQDLINLHDEWIEAFQKKAGQT